MKTITEYHVFEALDIRVGRVCEVTVGATRKPTYRVTIDFGSDIGRKVSCGAFRRYAAESLLGQLVVGVVNFPAKRMGPEVSEVLMLGVRDEQGETVYLRPESDVRLGTEVF